MDKLDKLEMKNNPHCSRMLELIGENMPTNEVIVYSNLLIKINRRGKKQLRTLLITNKAVYNCMPKNVSRCKRRIPIEEIASITISTISNEFVLHIPRDYDYRFKSDDKDVIGKVLKYSFVNINQNRQLPIQQVELEDLCEKTVTKEHAKVMTQKEREDRLWELQKPIVTQTPLEACDEEKDKSSVFNMLKDDTRVGPNDFELLKVIGRGAFGKVMQVRYKKNKQVYAMKILKKKQIVAKNQITHTKSERKILQALQHPFLMKLRFAFQTDSKLYLVLDYYRGGELFFHLKRRRKFTEWEARIFVAEVALALGHLHSLDIIYRDLKPENILLHQSGHICLTDFGLSKDLDPVSPEAHTFCGTPEYLAPEIVKKRGHGKAVDWWSLGILCYELCNGQPPFNHQNLQSMFEKIRKEAPRFPASLSRECQDLISRLLIKNPKHRLGSGRGGIEEIKMHPWFKEINWDDLLQKKIDPPYKPAVKSVMDTSNFSPEFTKETAQDTQVEAVKLAPEDDFHNFTYIPSTTIDMCEYAWRDRKALSS